MTLPQWEAASLKKRIQVFLILDLIIFTLLFVAALLRTLGVLAGPAPSPILWILILVGFSASLYSLFCLFKRPKQGNKEKDS